MRQTDAQRREHERWLRKTAAESARLKLSRARHAVRDARRHKRRAVARAREVCRQARLSSKLAIKRARVNAKKEIARLRAHLRDVVAARRAKVNACCGRDRARVKAEQDARVKEAQQALAALQKERRTERIWSAKTTPAEQRRHTRERAKERDEDVERSLSPDELVLFRRIRKDLPPPSSRASRLEQFHRWVQEHSSEAQRILNEEAERQLQEALRNEEKERRAYRELQRAIGKRSPRALAKRIRRDLDDVPF